MKKKIFIMFLLLALAVGMYAMKATAKGDRVPGPTSTAVSIATAEVCRVNTGVDGGTVNLRACGSIACKVLDIVNEGERLTILTAGLWANVTTEDGVTGWLNSKYCKGK